MYLDLLPSRISSTGWVFGNASTIQVIPEMRTGWNLINEVKDLEADCQYLLAINEASNKKVISEFDSVNQRFDSVDAIFTTNATGTTVRPVIPR